MDIQSEIQSEAFRQAEVRSERIRILGILVTLALALVIAVFRILLVHNPLEENLFPGLLMLVGGMAGYEWFMLRAVREKIRLRQDLSPSLRRLNLFVEVLFPTLAIWLVTVNPIVGPFRALVAPDALLYFFFIILSTLRLDPWHCRLTGLFSACGYIFMIAYTWLKYPGADRLFAQGTFLTYAAMIFLGGIVAGGVAGEIRKHVLASLQEAETRHQMEQIEKDLQTARDIQQGLLPKQPPQVEGFDIAGWNQPADATGGDFYDWQKMEDGRVILSLADVSGHGIGPALLMAVCRAYARSGFAASSSLQKVLSQLNLLLAADLPGDRFVTYVAVLLDPVQSQFELTSAGHGPLLLYHAASDKFEAIEAQGIPLGLFPGYAYDAPGQFVLEPGDRLTLLTDGFMEWTNPLEEEFGLSRIQESLRASRSLPAAEAISNLYADVRRFAGTTPQADDLTAVILQRKGINS